MVANDHANERTETISVSVPFPIGAQPDTASIGVSGHQTAWRILQRWHDGSVRVAQAQFTDILPGNTRRTYEVAGGIQPLAGAFQPNNWVAQLSTNLRIGAEVKDTFQVPYRSYADGAGEVLQETPLVRVKRYRTYHTAIGGQAGIGRDYLTSTFYVTEFRDMPYLWVDWIVGNDYLGADNPNGSADPNLYPLGSVDVRQASFLVKGVAEAIPYRGQENAVENQTLTGDGFTAFTVMRDTYIDDAQTRRYRFLLRFESNAATPAERQRWRDTATAMIESPMYGLADTETWQLTHGLGLLGGPIDGPADSWNRAEADYQRWLGRNHFGTWGDRGDPQKTGTTGTPRNHPLSPELAHAVQAMHHRLLEVLEQKAWIQACRPYHLYGLQVGAEQRILLWDGVPIYPGSRDLSHESLGRRALYASDPYSAYRTMIAPRHASHGWEHFDHEHWSTDLLFDYWTISGDAWAQEELRQLGESLKAVMRLNTYATANVQAARAEGWTMQGFAQVYQATGDPAIKDYAMRRVREVILPGAQYAHGSQAVTFQSNYPGTRFPMPHRYFMPWQHGAVLYGFLGAYRFFREPELLQVAERVPTTVEYSWVTNYNDPSRGMVANGLRYYVPVEHNGSPVPANVWDNDPNIGVRWGDSPLGGAHIFLIGGLYHLAETTADPAVSAKALFYGRHLLGDIANDPSKRWSKWRYVLREAMLGW